MHAPRKIVLPDIHPDCYCIDTFMVPAAARQYAYDFMLEKWLTALQKFEFSKHPGMLMQQGHEGFNHYTFGIRSGPTTDISIFFHELGHIWEFMDSDPDALKKRFKYGTMRFAEPKNSAGVSLTKQASRREMRAESAAWILMDYCGMMCPAPRQTMRFDDSMMDDDRTEQPLLGAPLLGAPLPTASLPGAPLPGASLPTASSISSSSSSWYNEFTGAFSFMGDDLNFGNSQKERAVNVVDVFREEFVSVLDCFSMGDMEQYMADVLTVFNRGIKRAVFNGDIKLNNITNMDDFDAYKIYRVADIMKVFSPALSSVLLSENKNHEKNENNEEPDLMVMEYGMP
jgi:hypothetical protein